MKLNSFILLSIDNDSTDEALREVFIGNEAFKDLRKYIKDFILDRVKNGEHRSRIVLSDKLDADNIAMTVNAFLDDDSPWYKSIDVKYLRSYINEFLKYNPGRFDIADNYVMEIITFRIAEYKFTIETKGLGYLCDFE